VQLDRPPERVGREGMHLRLWLRQGNCFMQAIGFGLGDLIDSLATGVRIDMAFQPKVSSWRGRRRVEIHLEDIKLAGAGQSA